MEQLETHRRAVTGHCYRMLGSFADAEDAAQETFLRAWKAWDRFDGRSSVETWLYRIATNVCLDELEKRTRRGRPMELGAPGFRGEMPTRPAAEWVEPAPESRVVADTPDPYEHARLRQSIRLAFVAALQNLAPRQRAALLLTEVLGWPAAEAAETLGWTVPALNSALQRARAAAGAFDWTPDPLTDAQAAMLERYVAAFERYDVEGLVSLLREDAAFSMPPYAIWLQGPSQVRDWLLGIGKGCRGSRILPAGGCGWPVFGQYRVDPEGGWMPWALVVLELDGDRIAGWNSFLDTARMFPLFGLPGHIPGPPTTATARC